MKTVELMQEIEKTYNKHFPKSKISVTFSKNLYSSIWIKCFLAGDKTENSGNYWDNDMFSISFQICAEGFKEFSKNVNLDSDLGIVSLENHHKYYFIKPDTQYCVYGSKKLSFRKIEGNPEKILKSLDTFFEKLKLSLMDDLKNDNITANYKSLVESKM